VQTGVAAIYTVVFVGIKELLKLLVGFYQGINHIYRVLKMYVIIGSAVYQQVVAL
jgi:hypothetical protein